MKMALKACPRCGGDLMPDASDRDGRTYSCLQCGVEVPYERIVLRHLQLRPVAAVVPPAA